MPGSRTYERARYVDYPARYVDGGARYVDGLLTVLQGMLTFLQGLLYRGGGVVPRVVIPTHRFFNRVAPGSKLTEGSITAFYVG